MSASSLRVAPHTPSGVARIRLPFAFEPWLQAAAASVITSATPCSRARAAAAGSCRQPMALRVVIPMSNGPEATQRA